MDIGLNSLTNLAKIRKEIKRKRISSYDKSGANMDNVLIASKDKHEVCNIEGAGIIKHIWMTIASSERYYLRKIVIRMWWDDEIEPSVEAPIGDFFGVGHGMTVNFWSMPFSCGPNDGKGFNCFFPMPFSKRARIEVENECDKSVICYYYIDYEEHPSLDAELGRFHAYWNRENPCKGNEYGKKKSEFFIRKNPDHLEDYLILQAEGEGHFVGCHLDIHNLMTSENNPKNKDSFWPGEGDDYIEIDDKETILY